MHASKISGTAEAPKCSAKIVQGTMSLDEALLTPTSQKSPSKSMSNMATACRCGIARPFTAVRPGRVQISRRCVRRRALAIDWSDPDTLIGAAGAVAGVALGIGVPLFYISRDNLDEQRLEELRDMNRKHFEETGSYLTDEEIRRIRIPRWTDRREFQDDD